MVFYAYVKWSKNADSWRWMITAPSFEVLDEWWRVISSKQLGYQRLSPEFYIYNDTNPQETLTNAIMAPDFLNKIMVILQNDSGGRSLDVIPFQRFTDHVSGNSFFIRSKSNTSLYWYITENKGVFGFQVYLSSLGRTRFHIQAKDKNLNGKVLIGSDDITISAALGSRVFVSTGADGTLISGNAPGSYSFSDLLSGGFLGVGEGNGMSVVQSDSGEDWELVS